MKNDELKIEIAKMESAAFRLILIAARMPDKSIIGIHDLLDFSKLIIKEHYKITKFIAENEEDE